MFSSAQEVSSVRTLGDSQCADAITDRECDVTGTTGSGNSTVAANIVSILVVCA